MAVQLLCLSRRLGHTAAARTASRRIHASVLLAPNIAIKGQSVGVKSDRSSAPSGSNADTLLQETEDRLRVLVEEAAEKRAEKLQLEVAMATARAAKLALPGLRQQLLADDAETQLSGAAQIRRMLSDSEEAPIVDIVAAGLVEPLVALLCPSVAPHLQLEAAWALTNIASGSTDHVREVVEHGAVPALIQLLASPHDYIREQAVWALGNIAGDSPELRDQVISGGALSAVCEILQQQFENGSSLAQTASWVLANFCRGSPSPSCELLEPAFVVLEGLLHAGDEEVEEQACWALTYLTGTSADNVSRVVRGGLCKKLADMLPHKVEKIQVPTLRVLGNIAAATDEDTLAVVECDVLPTLVDFMGHANEKLRRGACWTLSNIFVGCPKQIQNGIDNGIVKHLLPLLQSGPLEVRKEATWALGNMAMHGEPHQVTHLVESGCVMPIVGSLHVFDDETNIRLLEVIERILCVGRDQERESTVHYNLFAMLVQQANILGKIEAFKSHSSADIQDLALRVLAHLA